MPPDPPASIDFSVRPDGECIRFHWSCGPDGPGAVRLRLSGELDLASVEELGASLLVAEEGSPELTVDLAHLQFIDCAAIGCLFRAARRISKAGRRLLIVGARGQVSRVLELTGGLPGAERLVHDREPTLCELSGSRPKSSATAEGLADVA